MGSFIRPCSFTGESRPNAQVEQIKDMLGLDHFGSPSLSLRPNACHTVCFGILNGEFCTLLGSPPLSRDPLAVKAFK